MTGGKVMITLAEILNYKCLRYVRVPLNKFHIFVGSNASGKSAFFDALLFLRDLLNSNAESAVRRRAQTLRELVWQQQGERFEIAVELTVPDKIRNRNGLRSYSACRYVVQVGTSEQEGIAVTAEQFWLVAKQIPPKLRHSLFPGEPLLPEDGTLLKPQHKPAPEGWRREAVVQRTDAKDYFHSEIGRWNPIGRYPRIRPALNYVPEGERFPIAIWARKLLSEKMQLLQLNPILMRQPCPPDAPKTFQPDGSNLPMLVRHLRQDKPKQCFRWWLSHLQVVLPDLTDVTIAQFPHNLFLYLQVHFASGLTVPQWLLSDRTLRLMALTLLPYVTEPESVWLIEEPENGVHPTAIEELFNALRPPNRGQILVATHSPMPVALLDRRALPYLLCFARTKSGATDIVRGDEHPRLENWQNEINLSVIYAGGGLD